MFPTEIKLCCKMLGTATTAILLKRFHENAAGFSCVFIVASLRNTNSIASTQLTPWQMNVAHATPETPMLNAVTNRISTPMFESDEHTRNINGVLESPSAEKIPVAIL